MKILRLPKVTKTGSGTSRRRLILIVNKTQQRAITSETWMLKVINFTQDV